MNKNIILAILVIIVAGGSFFGGMKYQQSKTPSFPRQFGNGQNRPSGVPGRNGFGQGGRPISGEITSLDEKSLTVKSPDGSSKIIIYSDSTTINKTTEGAKSDLKVGDQIMVIGIEGSDGTITSQSISLGGNFMRNFPNNRQEN